MNVAKLTKYLGANTEWDTRGNVVNEKQHRGWHPWKVLLKIVVYLAAILALAYAARQLEGFSVGRIDSEDVPSFLTFFR